MPLIKIERCLCESGYKPYYVTCRTHKVNAAHAYFNTLKELKDYYDIKKITKAGEGWAISYRGKRHEWPEYEAEISDSFIM